MSDQSEKSGLVRTTLFGAGEAARRYISAHGDKITLVQVVDNCVAGDFMGLAIERIDDLQESSFDQLIIASSAVAEILPQIRERGMTLENVYWFDAVASRLVHAVDFFFFGSRAHLVNWLQYESLFESSFNTTMVEPDSYKKLIQGVSYCLGSAVEGDVAEFGTCHGDTASILAKSLNYYIQGYARSERAHDLSRRNLHLFDSFEGFPSAQSAEDRKSPHIRSGVWGAGTATGLSAVELLELCERYLPKEQIKIYEGWYKDTLCDIPASTRFALLHMDCDLYSSTYEVLDYLLENDQLSDGCAIFFDNWNSNRASPRFGERKAWADCVAKYQLEYSDSGEYGCNSHKFILHR